MYKNVIYNSLVEAIQAGPFLPVYYDSDLKTMAISSLSDAVPPASIAANEVSAVFGEAIRNRRQWIMERQSWRWLAIVKFNREVTCEVFEDVILNNPILLAADKSTNRRQIQWYLVDVSYIHPPRQQPSSGTQVTFTIEIRLGPV
jgi:hypothetical protein